MFLYLIFLWFNITSKKHIYTHKKKNRTAVQIPKFPMIKFLNIARITKYYQKRRDITQPTPFTIIQSFAVKLRQINTKGKILYIL